MSSQVSSSCGHPKDEENEYKLSLKRTWKASGNHAEEQGEHKKARVKGAQCDTPVQLCDSKLPNIEEKEDEEEEEGKQTREIGVQCDSPFMSFQRCSQWSDKQFEYYTALSKASFEVLFHLLDEDGCDRLKYKRTRRTPQSATNPRHSPRDKLFLTLVRLRRGYSVTDMSMLFGMSESSISDIFNTWLRLLSIKFKSMEEAIFLSAQAQAENKPDCYEPFPNLRCVVDSTDVKIQKPQNMEQQCNTFSSYKASNVLKFLVATSLYGGLSFISEGMEGNISDRQLFLRSGIMDHLQGGDAVMADRGFDIEHDLNELGVECLIPPYLGRRQEFTEREVLLAKSIASSRIHVETFIGRIKFFKLIRNTLPNTLIDVASDIVRVCANLVNFSDPFIRWKTARKTKKKKVSK